MPAATSLVAQLSVGSLLCWNGVENATTHRIVLLRNNFRIVFHYSGVVGRTWCFQQAGRRVDPRRLSSLKIYR